MTPGSFVSRLHNWLATLVDSQGSDLHLKVGTPPVIRRHGRLERLGSEILDDSDAKGIICSILTKDQLNTFDRGDEVDLAYSVPGLARFRVNVFRQRGHAGAVFRLIPMQVDSMSDLGLPKVVETIAERRSGLVLVTGPTGSGKSTTLASMIQYVNQKRRAHIITLEDPIEFVYRDDLSSITQREVGADTHSFASALKHSLRQNPDVILVGELRDRETMSLAVTAAETGHLVFATLHTSSAAQTVDRIIDVFPPEQQAQIRSQLASTLEAVISQTLMAKADGSGRIPALEILIRTPAIASTIREGKTHQIHSLLQSGRDIGMITLDEYLKNLYVRGDITFEEARSKCSNPRDFEDLLKRNLSCRIDSSAPGPHDKENDGRKPIETSA